MNEEHIKKIKQLLTEWNPLGDRSTLVSDLNNYETEAIDILFFIDNKSSIDIINKITNEVLSQAFNIFIDLNDSRKYAEKIKKILNNK